jgi:hypothetical protein
MDTGRTDCASHNPLRSPFFGETLITSFSGDAAFARVRTTPSDAFSFAQGMQIGLPPYDTNDQPTRSAQLRRPLDFTAVTDHSEFLGEIRTCLTQGAPGYDDPTCMATRTEIGSPPAGTPRLQRGDRDRPARVRPHRPRPHRDGSTLPAASPGLDARAPGLCHGLARGVLDDRAGASPRLLMDGKSMAR